MTKFGGIAVRETVKRHVELVCPRCGGDSDGTVLDLQRWYYMCGFPAFPLARLESVVECDECGYRSSIGLLDIATTDVLSRRLETAMRHAVVTVVRAAAVDEPEVSAELVDEALDVMRTAGFEYVAGDLRRDLADVTEQDAADSLAMLAEDLTPHGKQGFLHRMTSIAVVDGDVTRAEQDALVHIGIALGMAAPHINGVLAVATLSFQAA